ncbi:MAG: phosphatidate cytidylyltransferase [Candidatus Bathyarchaeia archaeon]|jgi:dolichol kinase
MLDTEAWANLALLGSCYGYILIVILVTGKIGRGLSRNSSRKFLHIMIGNLPFLIPFFSYNTFPLNFPFFVAVPFVFVTFLVSPYSPVKSLSRKMSELTEVTKGGHQLGLVFYAISYTVLAWFFSAKPYVIAAGILPMAYGDAAASLVGEKFGKRHFRILAKKSLEGSVAMFAFSFVSFEVSLLFFSAFYSLPLFSSVLIALAVAAVATVAEALTPRGFDNITVPFLGALLLLLLKGWA